MLQEKIGFVIIFILAIGACSEKPDSKAPDATVGALKTVSGKVMVNGSVMKVGAKLALNDEIQTGKGANTTLLLRGGSIIQMQENTGLVLDLGGSADNIKLKTGGIAAVVKKGKDRREMNVITPTAVAGVRGTSFYVRVESPEKSYVCTCNGTVHYRGIGQELGHDLTAQHHSAEYFEKVGDQVLSTKADMKYHVDHDLEQIAEQIDVKIDWSKAE